MEINNILQTSSTYTNFQFYKSESNIKSVRHLCKKVKRNWENNVVQTHLYTIWILFSTESQTKQYKCLLYAWANPSIGSLISSLLITEKNY